MSGVFKSVGKVFKKVAKVVKKVALPALAIAAVVLTGGAALGVLPALGTTLGGLGLSAGLTGVLTTAAQGATMGFLTSAITGGNPLKGATTGLITGGLVGGAGALLSGAGSAAGAAGSGGLLNGAKSASDALATITPGAASTIPLATSTAASGVVNAGVNAATAAAVPAATGGGGLLSFLNQNPVLAGNVLNGIGGGMAQASASKDARKAEERLSGNYLGYAGTGGGDPLSTVGKVDYDPKSGRIIPRTN
tara:strand:+ start:3906 stop:4655 length:750 start_codon:yes stop_codon:yes gene_type:complete